MPLFITYASYSTSGVKGIVDKPVDRTGAIKALVEKAGGKLVAVYMTTGSHDVVIVSEAADGFGCASRSNGCIGKWRGIKNRNGTRLDAERIQRHRGKGCQGCRCLHPARQMIG